MPISKKLRDVPAIHSDAEGPLLDLPLSNDDQPLDPVLHDGGAEPPAAPVDNDRRPVRRRRGSLLWLIPLLAFPIGLLAGYFFYSDPPVAAASVDRLDFGEVRVASTSEDVLLRVANHGERVLWVSETALEGDGAERFRVVDDGCAGLEMAAMAECTIHLTFTPDTRGPHQALLRLHSNDPDGPLRVAVSGLGVMPELSVTPEAIDLGTQTVGRAGASGDLLVGNRGTAPLVLRRVELTGGATADFLRVADDCSGRRLDPGGRCSVRFTFVPRVGGERRAMVRIEHDAGPEPATVTLVGQAVRRQAILQLDPAVVDFGARPLGELSPVQSIRVANAGNDTLEIRAVRLDTSRRVGGEAFELVSESCTAAAVPPGGECAIEVRFESIAESAVEAILAITSSASADGDEVLLTGLGSAPHLLIEPLQLRFGQVGVGTGSPVAGARLRSSGSAELRIANVSVAGADAASFTVGGCSGAVLAPGQECTVEARFEPRRPGPHRAELIVTHNADAQRHQLALNGLGVAARLTLEPAAIDFGEVPVGTSKRRLLTLANSGRADLEIDRLRLTGGRSAGFALESDRCSGTVLRPSETCRVTVLLRPISVGTRHIRLAVEHSASPDRPRELSIQAVAIP